MRPDSPIASLPVSIRLALRDLKNNKLRALSFGLLLALALGLLLPSLVAPRISMIDWSARDSMQHAAGFRASSTPERQLLAVFSAAGNTEEEFLDFYPRASVFEELVIVPQIDLNFNDSASPYPLDIQVTSALFDQAPLAQTVTVLEGRTPAKPGEVALDLEGLADYPDVAAVFADMSIGQTRILDTNLGRTTVTLVGSFSPNLPHLGLLMSPVVVAPDTFTVPSQTEDEYGGSTGGSFGLAFGTAELGMEPAIRIAESFVGSLEPFRFSIASSTMANAQEFEFQMSRLTDGHPIDSPTYAMITLLMILMFLAVIGVPMFTLGNQRRQEEMVQLRRAGASTKTLWGSLVASAFLVAGGAIFFGLLGAVILLRLRLPFLPLHMVYAPENLATMAIVATLGAFGTALVAASIPAFFTLHNTDQLSIAQPGTSSSLGPGRKPALIQPKLALLILGAGISVLVYGLISAATSNYRTTGLGALIIGAIIILVGVYFLVPLLLTKLVVATQSRALPLRLAARELTTRPATTITAIVPVAFVSAFITIFGIIFRQHYLEDYMELGRPDPTYAMIFPILWVPIAAGFVIVLLTLSATYLSLPQLQQDRTALHNLGQPSNLTGRTEGVRAGLMAGLGVIIGSLVGVVLGLVILLFRYFTDDQPFPLQPGAFWAWETYLIAAIFPVALAYLGGRLMGERTRPGRLALAV